MIINILRSPIKADIIRGGLAKYQVPPSLSLDFTKQLYVKRV